MGDDTIDNVQMELQMWSADFRSNRVCSAEVADGELARLRQFWQDILQDG